MSESATADHPDYLALLLSGLHELDDRRISLPETTPSGTALDQKLFKRYAPVLNSLARVLLIKEAKLVVALVATVFIVALGLNVWLLASGTRKYYTFGLR